MSSLGNFGPASAKLGSAYVELGLKGDRETADDLRSLITGAAVWTADTPTLIARWRALVRAHPGPATTTELGARLAADLGAVPQSRTARQLALAVMALQGELADRARAGDPLLLDSDLLRDAAPQPAGSDRIRVRLTNLAADHPLRARLPGRDELDLPARVTDDGVAPLAFYIVADIFGGADF